MGTLRVFLAEHTVAMVTYCYKNDDVLVIIILIIVIIIILLDETFYQNVFGQFLDTMIVASSDKEWLLRPIKI